MENEIIENTLSESDVSIKPDYEAEILKIIRSNTAPKLMMNRRCFFCAYRTGKKENVPRMQIGHAG